MHEIVKAGDARYVVTEGRKVEFLKLPSGDYIRPANVEAIRIVADKADASTGEISARVAIDHRGSWYTVRFDQLADAQAYADALASICNKVVRGDPMGDEPRGKSHSREDLHAALADMQSTMEEHTAPGDTD